MSRQGPSAADAAASGGARSRPRGRAPTLRRTVQLSVLALMVYLFFFVSFPPGHVFDPQSLAREEWLPVELLLWLDPLTGISAALAGRAWLWALLGAGATGLLCLIVPRGFCGYVCPLGTLIDGFDWLVGRRFRRMHLTSAGGWRHVRYGLLVAVLAASLFGVMLGGFVAPLAVLTRGLLLTAGRVQGGIARGWPSDPPAGWAVYLSVGLFAGVFLLGLLGRRFWCRCVCPSGALLSLLSPLRLFERRVESTCLGCGRCVKACSFGAVEEDFSTRHDGCTFCRTCRTVCPSESIRFAVRAPRPQGQTVARRARRVFLTATVGGAATALGARWGLAAGLHPGKPIRPPGSVPEGQFLDLCIRCGQCIQVCPGPVLQPAGLDAGLEALWTPVVVPSHAGCHPDCNFCTQVCPTRAIRPLTLAEKKRTRIGLARVDAAICLAHTGQRDCRLCCEECAAAGYDAIEMRSVKLKLGDIPEGTFSDLELEEMSRIEAPFVKPEACVGCGLCEFRCHAALVRNEKVLPRSAVVVTAS